MNIHLDRYGEPLCPALTSRPCTCMRHALVHAVCTPCACCVLCALVHGTCMVCTCCVGIDLEKDFEAYIGNKRYDVMPRHQFKKASGCTRLQPLTCVVAACGQSLKCNPVAACATYGCRRWEWC